MSDMSGPQNHSNNNGAETLSLASQLEPTSSETTSHTASVSSQLAPSPNPAAARSLESAVQTGSVKDLDAPLQKVFARPETLKAASSMESRLPLAQKKLI